MFSVGQEQGIVQPSSIFIEAGRNLINVGSGEIGCLTRERQLIVRRRWQTMPRLLRCGNAPPWLSAATNVDEGGYIRVNVPEGIHCNIVLLSHFHLAVVFIVAALLSSSFGPMCKHNFVKMR